MEFFGMGQVPAEGVGESGIRTAEYQHGGAPFLWIDERHGVTRLVYNKVRDHSRHSDEYYGSHRKVHSTVSMWF